MPAQQEFYRAVEAYLLGRGLAKIGYQIGYGPTFKDPNAQALGSIKTKIHGSTLEAFVGTFNRKAMNLFVRMLLLVMVPYLLLIAELSNLNIISIALFLVLAFGYAAVGLILAYEGVYGMFPSTRRLQKLLMQTCDHVAVELGMRHVDKFTVVWQGDRLWRKGRLLAYTRPLLSLRAPFPEMVTEEEFLGKPSNQESTVKAPVWWKANTPMKIAVASLIVVTAALLIAILYRILSGERLDEILRKILS